ncbi:MAG: sialate O-acetylesterase, partial [bacterium]|nr:sialate O-acetylesterase [bacterium]
MKVFVLAGQSNMQGHGIVAAEERSNAGKGSLEWLTTNPATSDKYGHLVDAAGNWVSRDDVYI